MRLGLLIVCALAASVSSAQPAGLPQFSDYPAGPAYRGRVAPLVESSNSTARMFRTATRDAICYVTDASTTEFGETVKASRTCFVPRLGMVSRTEAGETLTLTAHTLR